MYSKKLYIYTVSHKSKTLEKFAFYCYLFANPESGALIGAPSENGHGSKRDSITPNSVLDYTGEKINIPEM